jgi:hypothetical protein
LFLTPLAIVPFNEDVIWTYGKIRTDLEKRGTPIGAMDTMIAAHALSLNLTLVTNNVREFERVKGLRVENWECLNFCVRGADRLVHGTARRRLYRARACGAVGKSFSF